MYGVQHLVEPTKEERKVVLWADAENVFGLVFESMEEVEGWIAYMRSVANAVFEEGMKSGVLNHPELTG